MRAYGSVLASLAVVVLGLAGAYGLGALLVVVREPLRAAPFLAGGQAIEHALSRFHVRWYAVTLLFLAFDMEMVFMYPWAVVFADIGVKALVEMFTFLAILMVGVLYAWREGALRWT
jgi:NADH-quinone oxidoreductase subunit A